MELNNPYHVGVIAVKFRENDEKFNHLQELIEAKKQMLINKQKNLRLTCKQNQFLEIVKNDYAKFYEYVSQQKKEQIKALQILDEYIKDLTINGKLTKYNIEDAKQEQRKILNELNSLKKKLDAII